MRAGWVWLAVVAMGCAGGAGGPSGDAGVCLEDDTRSCGTDVGACELGAQTCTAGVFGPCEGGVLPAAAEICGNEEDDDCDGVSDEDCGCATSAGGAGNDAAYGMAALMDGSVIVVGIYEGDATFGAGEDTETTLIATQFGYEDGFVARYDAACKLDWVHAIDGPGRQIPLGVAALPDGGTLVAGQFSETATFAPGELNEISLSAPGFDLFLARYDSAGSLVWARQAGGGVLVWVGGVAALEDGRSWVTGSFEQDATFGPGESGQTALTGGGPGDLFLAHFRSSGDLEWVSRAIGPGIDDGNALDVLSDGSVIVAGEFGTTLTLGPGEGATPMLPGETTLDGAGDYDAFVAKFDPSGRLVWANGAGGAGYDEANGVAVLDDGSALVAGSFGDGATFGLETLPGVDEIFLARFASSGALLWVRSTVGSGFANASDVGALADGTAFVTGLFDGTITFGPGGPKLRAESFRDIFVARYDPSGSPAWAARAGGLGDDMSYELAVHADGGVAIAGAFPRAATFFPGTAAATTITSAAGQDIFIAIYPP